MDKLEIKRALLYNKPSILDSQSGGNQCFDTQARRSSRLRYFRSLSPILLVRTVRLVAKFEDWSSHKGINLEITWQEIYMQM
jgi:hypothetical protein